MVLSFLAARTCFHAILALHQLCFGGEAEAPALVTMVGAMRVPDLWLECGLLEESMAGEVVVNV